MAYQRVQIDSESETTTEQLFRAPELLDLFSDFPISEKMDIFSLGCILYHCLFFKSAFDPDLKLDQMNARYTLPTKVSAEM
jgi:cyclin G-associated kinase